MLDTKTRRTIAMDYWFNMGIAITIIITGIAGAGWDTPGLGTHFAALAFIIHAHGNRIRQTLLALHTKDS